MTQLGPNKIFGVGRRSGNQSIFYFLRTPYSFFKFNHNLILTNSTKREKFCIIEFSKENSSKGVV